LKRMFLLSLFGVVRSQICQVNGVPSITDTAGVAQYETDWSYWHISQPRCAFRPTSAIQVREIVRFANDKNFDVAVQGTAHSTNGQSLTDKDGVTIDTSLLNTVSVEPACALGLGNDDDDDSHITTLAHTGCWPINTIVVGAGNVWEVATSAAFAAGFRVVGHVDSVSVLSVGGTLSMGSMNALSLRLGPGVQHVAELLVVTGKGEIKRASMRHNQVLFKNVLGGIGLFGVIVEARMELQPLVELPPLTVPPGLGALFVNHDPHPHVYQFTILFFDAGTYHDELVALSNNPAVDGIESFIIRNDASQVGLLFGAAAMQLVPQLPPAAGVPYLYIANVVDIAPASFDVFAYLGSLAPNTFLPVVDVALNYQDWVSRQDLFLSLAESSGVFLLPKAVGNAYIANSPGLRAFFVAVMAQLSSPAFLGALVPGSGYSGAYTPIDSRVVTRETLFRLPRESDSNRAPGSTSLVFNLDLNWLQSGIVVPLQGQAVAASQQQAVIDQIFQRAVRQFPDSTFYPYTAPIYCWKRHWGPLYNEVKAAKELYDPHHVLGNGVGVFPQQYNSACPHDDDDDQS